MPTQYQHVAEQMREAILSGRYDAGSKLPTERALCGEYDVSRITIRQALTLLESEQLIIRRQGSGTFVRQQILRRIPLKIDYAASMQDHAPSLARRLLLSRTQPAPAIIAEQLQVSTDDPLLYAERLDYLAGEPVAWDQAYIPQAFAEGMTDEVLASVSFVSAWQGLAGFSIHSCEQTIEATSADDNVAAHLELPLDSPVLKATELYLSPNSKRLGLFISYYHPAHIQLSATHLWQNS